MLKFANDLSDDYEYAIVWWGQSNARPWGDRDLEGYKAAPHLALSQPGQDLTILSSVLASGIYPTSTVLVAESLTPDKYAGAEIRLVFANHGDSKVTAKIGYGTVLSNTNAILTVAWDVGFIQASKVSCVFNINQQHIDKTGHGMNNGDEICFCIEAGSLPYPIVASRKYYVVSSNNNDFKIAETVNGPAIPFAASGNVNAFYVKKADYEAAIAGATFNNIPGYVNIKDYWQKYDNIRVLTPYSPEAPGDYPAGAPTVPGYSFPATVTGYKDAATWLNFAWNEGVEGHGDTGISTGTGATSLTDNTKSWTPGLWVGGYVRCDGSRAKITANTATGLTIDAWVGGTPTNPSSYEIALPHWRDNPYAFNPGFGFRYPSNDMQPCSASTVGQVYNRPLGRLTPGYKSIVSDYGVVNGAIRALCSLPVNPNDSSTGLAIYTAGAGNAALTPSVVGSGASWKLRITTNGNGSNPLGKIFAVGQICNMFALDPIVKTGVALTKGAGNNATYNFGGDGLTEGCAIEFTNLGSGDGNLTVGTIYYVLNGTSTISATPNGTAITISQSLTVSYKTANINGDWYVNAVAANGSYVDLTPKATNVYPSIATSLAGTSAILRVEKTVHHRFGSLVECAWRVSNMIGKRIHVIHLGINSSAQILRNMANYFGYKGKIGWWDYNKYLDWTPGNPDGDAARLERMIKIMAPAALTAEGNTKPLRVLGIFGFQGEGDAIVTEGRELYEKTLHTFYGWLRNVIYKAGLTFFNTPDKIPVVHASLPSSPWEQSSFSGYGVTLNGDTQGLVNSAIESFAAKDGYAATFDTNGSPKLTDSTTTVKNIFGSDPLHFNGYGEAINGRLASDAWSQVAIDAIPHIDNELSVQICNLALSHIGDTAKITSINPTDGSTQATLCARFYPMARDSLMEMLSWAFATKRKKLVEVSNPTTSWDYAYAMPVDVASGFTILPPDVQDDYSTRFAATDSPGYFANNIPIIAAGRYAPQPFAVETDEFGNEVIYTDQENAEIRYIAQVTDASKFSPLFTVALSWHLASMLAGPIIKGDQGAAEAKRCQQMMLYYLSKAQQSDSQQRSIKPEHIVQWMSGR